MFNDCHYTVDSVGTRVFRGVDNNVVTFVSTVHGNNDSVLANRKKPRMTAVNRQYVKEVWGGAHVKEINIPQFIDDYNHMMNAVDRADQLISAYTMKHRCCRSWTPFLLFIINIIRINSFVAHRELQGSMSHMAFTLGLVRALYTRRNEATMTRKRAAEEASPSEKKPVHKRMRNGVDPLPDLRLRHPETHKPTFYKWRRTCFYCRYKAAKARSEKKTPGKINICSRGCPACGDIALVKHALTNTTLKTCKKYIFFLF